MLNTKGFCFAKSIRICFGNIPMLEDNKVFHCVHEKWNVQTSWAFWNKWSEAGKKYPIQGTLIVHSHFSRSPSLPPKNKVSDVCRYLLESLIVAASVVVVFLSASLQRNHMVNLLRYIQLYHKSMDVLLRLSSLISFQYWHVGSQFFRHFMAYSSNYLLLLVRSVTVSPDKTGWLLIYIYIYKIKCVTSLLPPSFSSWYSSDDPKD